MALEECHKEGSSGLSRVPLDGEIKYTVHRYFSLLSLVPFSGDKVFASPFVKDARDLVMMREDTEWLIESLRVVGIEEEAEFSSPKLGLIIIIEGCDRHGQVREMIDTLRKGVNDPYDSWDDVPFVIEMVGDANQGVKEHIIMLLRKIKEEGIMQVVGGFNGSRQCQRLSLFDWELRRLERLVNDKHSGKGR